MEFPNEICNIISSYIEGPTNQIIKDLYFHPIRCLQINKRYNFKHINIPRLLKAIDTRCPYCDYRLNPEEYIYRGIYEKCSGKKLCKECLEKEIFRTCVEFTEIFFILFIFIFIWLSILHVIMIIQVAH
jgi:hypothetical protein